MGVARKPLKSDTILAYWITSVGSCHSTRRGATGSSYASSLWASRIGTLL